MMTTETHNRARRPTEEKDLRQNIKKHTPSRTGRQFFLCCLLFVLAVIALVDGRHPLFYLIGGKQTEAVHGEAYEDPGVYAVLTGRVFGEWQKHLPLRTEGSVDTDTLGSYPLSYSTRFLLRTYRCERTVQVVDRKPPVITLFTREGYRPNWPEGYQEEGFRAEDDVDGDVTDRVTVELRGETVLYTVQDSAGNTATAERRPDYTLSAPVIYLTGGEELHIPASLHYTDPGYAAIDRFGDDYTAWVKTEGEVIPYRAGTYDVSYTATNLAGHSVQALRRVTVEANPVPETVIPEEKTIYLTFDDGPGPYTDRLLDVLDRYGVKATFFVTCDEPSCFDCIGRAYREGHTIGVHSASHVYQEIYAGEEAFFEDFEKVQDLIFAQTGQYAAICRFPGGSSNTVSNFNPGIMTRLASDLHDLGYQYFDWDVYSGDAGGKGATKESETVFSNVTEGIGDRQTAVVLQHDIKDYSVDAVEKIILWGLEHGYVFRPLDAGSPPAHETIVN